MSGNNKKTDSEKLRLKAEQNLKLSLGKRSSVLSDTVLSNDQLALLHELQIHEIELKMQNEELLDAKQNLENALTKFEDFYDLAPISYFTIAQSGIILEVNLTGAKLLNVARSHLLGLNIKTFINVTSKSHFSLFFEKAFTEEINSPCEVCLQPKDKDPVWVLIQFSRPVLGGKCLAVVINITDLKKTENELSRTKNYLEQLIDSANGPIVVWNPNSEIVLFNKSFERLTGYCAEEVINKKLDILLPYSSMKRSRAAIEHTITGNHMDSIEIPVLCKNLDTKIILWNSANIYNDDRELIATIAQGNDITSRKNAEKELEESQRKLDLALQSGNIGIWDYDVKSGFLFLDERMEKMTGITEPSFENDLDSFEEVVHDEDKALLRESFRRTIHENSPFGTILRVKGKGKHWKYLNVKGILFKEDEVPSRILGVAIDITEMKNNSESILFKLNEELARSNRELQQFAYVASHDLQEPLRMVSSFTQLLALKYENSLDQNAKEYIRYAVDGSKRMYDLINGLLTFSRIETKSGNFEDVEIAKVLKEVLKNLKFSIEQSKAKITIGKMPAIRASKNQMIQLFQNLLSNSIKFSTGIPKISLSSEEKKDFYLFTVKDHGIGIDPEYHEKIFQIFQRLVSRDEYEGTGIGLSICKRIVERHKGRIWVNSKSGEGSTFLFTIGKRLSD